MLLGHIGKSFYNDPYFGGKIDNLRVWDRALSIVELFGDEPSEDATVESIAVKSLPTKTSYTVGEEFSASGVAIEATMSDGSKRTLESDEYSLGTVDMASAGTKTVTVTLTSDTKVTTSFTITVTEAPAPPVEVDSIQISGAGVVNGKLSLKVGDSVQLSAAVLPDDATNKTVVWSVTGSGVLVSPTGLITATKTGTATVTVSSAGTPTVSAAVTVTVTDADKPEVTVDRLSGATRFETSAKVAAEQVEQGGKVVVATGMSFADAVSATTLAKAQDATLVLVNSNYVAGDMRAILSSRAVSQITIVGGTQAVSPLAEKQLLSTLPANSTIKRLSGTDRYETSRKVLKETAALNGGSLGVVTVTTGRDFADALAGTVYASGLKGATLLVSGNTTAGDAAAVAAAKAVGATKVRIIGGTSAVGAATERSFKSAVSDTSRLAGDDRYATAAKVNDIIDSELGNASEVSRVWVTSGSSAADTAVAVSALDSTRERLVLTKTNCMTTNVIAHYPATERITLVGGKRC